MCSLTVKLEDTQNEVLHLRDERRKASKEHLCAVCEDREGKIEKCKTVREATNIFSGVLAPKSPPLWAPSGCVVSRATIPLNLPLSLVPFRGGARFMNPDFFKSVFAIPERSMHV